MKHKTKENILLITALIFFIIVTISFVGKISCSISSRDTNLSYTIFSGCSALRNEF